MEKRRTTVHDRFQVDCSYCGFLDSFMTRADAKRYAEYMQKRHNTDVEIITIYDVMAHKPKETQRDTERD